jgi:hypothetical protein
MIALLSILSNTFDHVTVDPTKSGLTFAVGELAGCPIHRGSIAMSGGAFLICYAAVFAVSSTPSARITASVVFSVGFPFLLNDR